MIAMLSAELTKLSFNAIDFLNFLSICQLLAAGIFCYFALKKDKIFIYLMGTCLCKALLPASSLVIYSKPINGLFLSYFAEPTVFIFVISFYAWPLFFYAFLNQAAARRWHWQAWIVTSITVFAAALLIGILTTPSISSQLATNSNMIYIAPKWAASLLWLPFGLAYLHLLKKNHSQPWIKSAGLRALTYLLSCICLYGFIIAACNTYFKTMNIVSGNTYALFVYGFTFSNIVVDFSCLMLSVWIYLRVTKSIGADDYNKQIDRYLTDENINKINEHIIVQKLYLKTHLSLDRCAEKLELPSRALTVIINHHYHKTFSEWITDLRISEAKRLLEDPQYLSFSVSEIASLSGFSSRSVFYSSFSKFEGMTPTQYRQHHAQPTTKLH